MTGITAAVAWKVVVNSSRDAPADGVLRKALRDPGFYPKERAEISDAVFSYFRWRNWLAHRDGVGSLRLAIQLADRFEADPKSVPDDELLERAFPAWLKAYAPVDLDWIRAVQYRPKLWLRSRPGIAAEVKMNLGQCRQPFPESLPECLEYRGATDLNTVPGREMFEIQDLASQIVGAICRPKAGEKWWDAFAGEGGKTLDIAGRMGGRGLVHATDRSRRRLARLRQRAARAQVFNWQGSEWDGLSPAPFKFQFDGILVDAPCSGAGTWQRNPHARWTAVPEDVVELAAVQQRLIALTVPRLKKGGRLVYAACTLTRLETGELADAIEREHPELEPCPEANPLDAGGEKLARHWIFPQQWQSNGMFIATWRKAK